VNKVGDIFFAIDGSNAAPTVAQRQYFAEVQPEYTQRMEGGKSVHQHHSPAVERKVARLEPADLNNAPAGYVLMNSDEGSHDDFAFT
jgi:hypothetical protein